MFPGYVASAYPPGRLRCAVPSHQNPHAALPAPCGTSKRPPVAGCCEGDSAILDREGCDSTPSRHVGLGAPRQCL